MATGALQFQGAPEGKLLVAASLPAGAVDADGYFADTDEADARVVFGERRALLQEVPGGIGV